MMFWHDHDLSAWGWVGMTFGMIVFWALVIAALVWVVRGFGRADADRRPEAPTPEQILAERFARGEIDKTEYQERLSTLQDPEPVGR